jgi:DNA-binding CsgD family transcriptional regulator
MVLGMWERLPYGVAVLDAEQRVLEASSFAVSAMSSVYGASMRPRERLCLPEPAQHELSGLLTSGLAHGRLSNGLLHVSRGEKEPPLSILVLPASAIPEGWMSSSPRWVLWIFDRARGLSVDAGMLESDLCLSHREAQVLAALAAGLSPRQIAEQLGISRNTLRSHLKSCYAKTGCGSRNELMQRVIGGPGALPPR